MASRPRAIDHVIFDVDDVLISMDRATELAARAIEAPLAARFGPEVAKKAQAAFAGAYTTLIEHLRLPAGTPHPTYRALRARIESWQVGVTSAGYEVKQWSRDSLLAVALEDAGVSPTSAVVSEALGAYWKTLTDEALLYPDADALCAELNAAGISFHLATNSDGFLVLDDARRTFVYDPAGSAERKVARLDAVKKLGVGRSHITVGDPIGKPGAAYYQRVVQEFSARLGRPLDLSRTLAVGDSLTADVLPFLTAGVKHGAWLQRTAAGSGLDVSAKVPVVRSLLELRAFIWSGG